jgi:fibronectin type 3 domain-containing protein
MIPAAIRDLAARQQGSRVVLTFTLPQRRTDGETLAGPPDIEIYRGFAPRSVATPAPPAQLTLTIPAALVDTYLTEGLVRFEDPLKPEDLSAHRNDHWVYAVRTRVTPRHSSAASNVAVVRVLPAPSVVQGVTATVTETAIELRWQPVENAIGYRVHRAEYEAVVPETAQSKQRAAVLLAAPPTTVYRDTQFQFDRRYGYTVRAVAQMDAESIESDPSDEVTVDVQDVFPPAAPQNLVVIPVPATADAPAAMDLSWSISPEEDLAGYHVFRSEQQGTREQRLTRDILLAPSFRDTSVTPDRRYTYWVTAVDRKGNESTRSASVSETAPAGQGR